MTCMTHVTYVVKACVKFILMIRKWNATKWNFHRVENVHYSNVMMSAMASKITGVSIVCFEPFFSRRSKKMSKPIITGLCDGNSPVTAEFSAPTAGHAEDVPTWWRHHGMKIIWWNGPRKLRQPNLRKVDLPWKGRSVSPLIDIYSSIKAIHKSVFDIMDIHNSNMDVYNSVMYIHDSIMDT